MSQNLPSPSIVQKHRSEFNKNFANLGTYFCDGCLLRNFSGPMFQCKSCDDFIVCQTCISKMNRFHNPSHIFKLRLKDDEQQLKHNGITCSGCSTSNFIGPRYNCQQCMNPYDLCQRCIADSSSLHGRGHTFVTVRTPNNQAVHQSTTCDGCRTTPIIGLRYKCQSCSDYDLCTQCYTGNTNGEIHDAKHKFQFINQANDSKESISQRAAQAIARIRAKYGPEYNGDAVDAETGWSIADARIQEQQDFQLQMMRTQIEINHTQNMTRIMMGYRW